MILDDALPEILGDLAEVYPDHLVEAGPDRAIVYRLVAQTETESHDGPTGLVAARYQLTTHGQTHADALELARALEARLGDRLAVLDHYTGDLELRRVRLETALDLGYDVDAAAWRYSLDVSFDVRRR